MSDIRARCRDIEERVAARASNYFPELDGSDVRAQCDPFGGASSYPILVCRLSRDGRQGPGLVVKFAPVFPDNNEGLTEYRHLQLMWDYLGPQAGALRVPRPLDYFEDINALVTEEVGGERFSGVLLNDCGVFSPPARVKLLRQRIHRCGEWLRSFHEATSAPPAPAFDNAYRAAVDDRLTTLTEAGLPERTAKITRRTLEDLTAYGRENTTAVSDLHGDYGPQNIHVGPDWLCAFDLSYNITAPVFDDITYFLVTLETLNPFPRHPLFSRRRAVSLQEDFLRGYYGPQGPCFEERVLIAGYYIKALVFRCAKQRRNAAGRSSIAKSYFDRTKLASYYPGRMERQCRAVSTLLDR